MARFPKVEVVKANLTLRHPEYRRQPDPSGSLLARILVAPRGGEPLVFPLHKLSARITYASSNEPLLLENASFEETLIEPASGPRTNRGSNLVISPHVAQFNGAEVASVRWIVPNIKDLPALYEERRITASVSLCAVDPEIEVQASLTLCGPQSGQSAHIWKLLENDVRICLTQSNDSPESDFGSCVE